MEHVMANYTLFIGLSLLFSLADLVMMYIHFHGSRDMMYIHFYA